MRSIVGMKAVAKLITEETQEGHNTAARVGGLFEDIVDYLDSADISSSLKIDRYVTTGTRIAKFTVGGEVVFTGTSTHCFLDLAGKPVFTEKVYPDFYADLKKCMEA